MTFPDIDPVALAVGPFQIRWYALAYLAGFLLGWRYILYLAGLDKDQKVTRQHIDDFLTWAIVGVMLGGRLGYVLFYQAGLYVQDPLEIFRIWHGGMSFHGGALGVIIAMIWFSAKHKIPVLRLTDPVCCAVPIGLFFGRLANFVNGELFGRPTSAPWGVVFPHGGPEPRHPSQIYEAGLEGLLLFSVLAVLAHRDSIRNRPGILSGIFLIGYGLSRITIECFREPDEQIGYLMGLFTMGQILSVPMIIFGLALIWLAFARNAAMDVSASPGGRG